MDPVTTTIESMILCWAFLIIFMDNITGKVSFREFQQSDIQIYLLPKTLMGEFSKEDAMGV